MGDAKAIFRAFGTVTHRRKLDAWEPDSAIGSWELFQEIIGAQSEDKVAWGEAMGRELAVDQPLEGKNRSPSYRKFRRRVREHAGEGPKIARRSRPR